MSDNDPASAREWLNANVVGLAINQFLSDFGHEAGTAILPLFLTAIGAPALALGVIEGVADGLSSGAKLFGGWLGGRVAHRRPWAASGYLLTGVTTGLYGLFGSWPSVLVVRAVGWAGRGLRSPLHDALLADSVPRSAHGRAFGFDEAADTVGAVAGPLAALAILGLAPASHDQMKSFALIFLLAAIPGVLAALSLARGRVLIRSCHDSRGRSRHRHCFVFCEGSWRRLSVSAEARDGDSPERSGRQRRASRSLAASSGARSTLNASTKAPFLSIK